MQSKLTENFKEIAGIEILRAPDSANGRTITLDDVFNDASLVSNNLVFKNTLSALRETVPYLKWIGKLPENITGSQDELGGFLGVKQATISRWTKTGPYPRNIIARKAYVQRAFKQYLGLDSIS